MERACSGSCISHFTHLEAPRSASCPSSVQLCGQELLHPYTTARAIPVLLTTRSSAEVRGQLAGAVYAVCETAGWRSCFFPFFILLYSFLFLFLYCLTFIPCSSVSRFQRECHSVQCFILRHQTHSSAEGGMLLCSSPLGCTPSVCAAGLF